MTTSGAAINARLVAAMGARIVVVEEAAEVMAAHVLACLTQRTQQLVPIGDHKQLRPKAQVHELTVASGRGYNLDVSLFEALAKAPQQPHANAAAAPRVTLTTQRRMRPAIARLVRATVYPGLVDAPCAAAHPPVRGVREPLFWLDHAYPEGGGGDEEEEPGVAGAPAAAVGTKENAGEAALAVALAKHLLLQVCVCARTAEPPRFGSVPTVTIEFE